MQYVEFYKLQNDGTQKVIATCHLNESGEVECEGTAGLIENLKKEGIRDYSDKDKRITLYITDGLKFLEQLKFNFTSGYLNASDVLKK